MALETAVTALVDLESAKLIGKGLGAIGAGLGVGLGGVGTGLAQQGIGAAAFGAIAEDKGMLGLALVFVAIPETLVILGLVISIMIMFI
ncbi:MAG TPA: ATPase [Methanocorpusculum sp.]|nr:ATPase [Methanocorpusculum sp.]HJJ39119.1 ATPase [Methanocorpusculum sp.]